MQTSYDLNAAAGLEGMIADAWPIRAVDSLIPSAAIPVGRFTAVDNTAGKPDNACKLPAAATDITRIKFMGISVLDLTRESGSGGAGIDYPASRPMPGLVAGRIWMIAETAMTRGVAPFVRWNAGNGGSVLGKIRNDADVTSSAATATQYPNARVLQTISAAGLVLVEFF